MPGMWLCEGWINENKTASLSSHFQYINNDSNQYKQFCRQHVLINNPMIKVYFKESKSKKYGLALELAKEFDDISFDGVYHCVVMKFKTILEKWDFFVEIFWIVVDWKDSYIYYEEFNYYCHVDKTWIFYAFQQAHINWLRATQDLIIRTYIPVDVLKLNNIPVPDEYIDRILDAYERRKEYLIKMKYLNRLK